MISLILFLSLKIKLYQICWCMIETSSGLPRKSSVLFYNLGREIFGYLRKSSILEISGKWSQIFGKSSKMLLSSMRSLVRYRTCSWHSNTKFIPSRHRVISSIYFMLSTCVTHQTNLGKYKRKLARLITQ